MRFADFMTHTTRDVARFHAWWLRKHQECPEDFPIEVANEHAALFDEGLMIFLANPDLCDPQPEPSVPHPSTSAPSA